METRPRAIKVVPIDEYKLIITFDNQEEKIFDVKPYFKFENFKELEDEKKFSTVRVAGISIEWCNGADICPDELYYDSISVGA